MTNPFIAALRVSQTTDPRWAFYRQLRRDEFAAKKFRELGSIGYAELYEGFAEQTWLEIEALDRMEQRIAALDAKLSGLDDPEITASAIAFGGPLPTTGEAA